MTNVLLTCANWRSYLIGAFQEALGGDGLVFATNLRAESPAMEQADRSFVTPPIDDPDYIASLLDICERNDVRLLVPLNDLELPLVAFHREEFIKRGVTPVVSSSEVVDTCFDKWRCVRALRSSGIDTAETYLSVADARKGVSEGRISFPLVIRPRWGSASTGTHVVYDDRELEPAFQYAATVLSRSSLAGVSSRDPERSLLIHEKLHGQECGLDVINDLDGNYVCTLARRKLAMRAGETDSAVTIRDEALSDIGSRISHHLRHVGVLDCDVFMGDDGYRVLEMNPRFGGGYPFSHMAGANIPAALIAWANGTEPDPRCFEMRTDVLSSKCVRLVLQPGMAGLVDVSQVLAFRDRKLELLPRAA